MLAQENKKELEVICTVAIVFYVALLFGAGMIAYGVWHHQKDGYDWLTIVAGLVVGVIGLICTPAAILRAHRLVQQLLQENEELLWPTESQQEQESNRGRGKRARRRERAKLRAEAL